jgi:phage N-6-adenine-methyltransferase
MFSKASDEWTTPQVFWNLLDDEFNFNLDVAASAENAKCKAFLTIEDDALNVDWSMRGYCGPPTCWLNPPYSKCRESDAGSARGRRGAR